MNDTTTEETEWAGTDYRRSTLPTKAETRPYTECPNCSEYRFRTVYSGFEREAQAECKACHYTEARDIRPDIPVYEPDPASGVFVGVFVVLLVVIGLLAIAAGLVVL